MEGTINCQVLHIFGSLVAEVLSKVDNSKVWLHVLTSDIFDPAGNGCREKTDLNSSSTDVAHFAKDLVDILLES